MTDDFDVIVAGVGAMGAAACWHLARRGLRVLGLEQFDLPHSRGSSHGYSRITRTAYFEHPDYVPLLRRAHALWRELEAESGENILHMVGGLYLGRPDGSLLGGSLRSARQHGLAHELLDRAEVARRFPQFEIPGDWCGLHETDAGYLLPELAIAAMVTQALHRGAEIHGHEEVLSWHDEGERLRVVTPRGEYRARQLIVAGGAWNGQLLHDLGIELVVTRQVLGWVWPREPRWFARGTLPIWIIDRHDGTTFYGFPMVTLSPGFKLARHAPVQTTDPNNVARDVLPGDEETFRAGLRAYLPKADGPLLALRTCLYTNSPDGHFILGRHPRHPRIAIAAGFSGHGFKFASVVGEALADLAQTGTTALPIGFLRPERFG